MNKVIYSGRLTADPEIRYSQGGDSMCIARFTLAVARKFKQEGQPEADFIRCVVFGKLGESVEKHLRKGMKICVCGHTQTDSYTNKDGVKVYTSDCVVEEWEFDEKKDASQPQQTPQQAQAQPQQAPQQAQTQQAPQVQATPGIPDIDPNQLGFI